MPWPYPDVAEGHWAAAAIKLLSETDVGTPEEPQFLMSGFPDRTFQPDPDDAPAAVGLLTRAQGAVLMARMKRYVDQQIAEAHDDTVKSAVNLVLQHLKSLGVTID